MTILRQAARRLRRRGSTTVVAVLVLGAAIGVTAALFSLVDTVLLRALPVPDADRLVYLVSTRLDGGGRYAPAYHNTLSWRRARALSQLAVFRPRSFLAAGEVPERLSGFEVSPEYFRTLGAAPRLGRSLTAEDRDRRARVAVISDGLWRRRFGGRADAVGRSLTLDGEPYTVVGVMPRGTESGFLGWRELWTPLAVDEAAALVEPLWGGFGVIARLRPEAWLDEVRRELAAIAARLAEELPAFNDGWGVEVAPVRRWMFEEVERPLLVLLGVAALVLLIACGTVSNLFLSTVAARRDALAVERALGASPGRLARELLAESALVTAAGSLVGLALAALAVAAIPALALDLPRIADVRLDLRVVAVMAAAAFVAALLAGLAPAVAASRVAPEALRSGSQRSLPGTPARGLLVAAETALATVAVIAAALLARTVGELRAVDPGFEPRRLLTLRLELPAELTDEAARRQRMRQLLERIEALPGVAVAAASGVRLPLEGGQGTFELYLEGHPRGARPEAIVTAQMVSPGYREAMGLELLAGRWLAPDETWEGGHAVVINQTMARRYWPGEDAVGRWVEWAGGERGTVIGVVADVRQLALDHAAAAEATIAWGKVPLRQALVVRAAPGQRPEELVGPIRRVVAELGPGVPLDRIATGEELVDGSYAGRRLWAVLAAGFAALALGLGLVGLYGVVSHAVDARRREIGLRMALGAAPRSILRHVVRRGMRPVAWGLGAGLAAAATSARLLEGLVYGVTVRDPLTLASVAASILTVAAAVCAGPAWRAARLDPSIALRQE